MAGPGGGPPRRSHTKSRKGCDACKRRHIRCDENFPQCRNCTKHKVRCPYNDVQGLEDRASPDGPDLMWTPEVRAAIDQWQRTGVFPFPSLGIYPTPAPQVLSVEKLRLIHHVASISHQMTEIGATGFTLWTRQIPTLIKIAATHDYVLHALLAFSAMHIAFRTDCPLVGNMAYEHRGIALKGLHGAIGDFSRESSDAILAASLLLSWQATDWRSWTQLMQGTSSVIDAMEPWKHESQFGDFIAESSTFPTAPPSPTPDHKPMQPSKEDLDAFQRALQQLRKVESHLKHNREDPKSIVQLANFLKGARKVSPTLSISQQFERLRPLRTWLFWLPVMFLQDTHGSPSALITIAHYYAVALLMERLFPEIGAAYFGSLSIGPVEEIARRLFSVNLAGSTDGGDLQTPVALMEYPIDTVNEFRSRMGWVQPTRTMSFPQYNPPNFYMDGGDAAGGSPMLVPAAATAASSSEYLPYGENPIFSYSTENLSVVTTDSAPNSAVSPLQLSPPYGNNTQYLSIPSPSYGGLSPTSSALGDFGDASSVAFSDNEDFGSFDACGFAGGGAPVFGGASNNITYGVGTPQLLASPQSGSLAASPYLHSDQQLSVPCFSPLEPPQPRHTSLSFHPGHRHNISTASAPPSLFQDGI